MKNSGDFKKGHIPWNKSGTHSEETKIKIREKRKLQIVSEDHRLKISLALKGKMPKFIPDNTGRKASLETISKLKVSHTGKTGEKASNWQGGKTSFVLIIRHSSEYVIWRMHCFQRDEYTCQECKQIGGELNVDHIIPFSAILQMYSIKTIEDAIACEFLWDIRNGRTLCVPCHKKTPTYCGKGLKRTSYTRKNYGSI